MEKTDLGPIISIFSDFFTTVYKPKIDRLLLVYPKKKSLELDYSELEKFDPDVADKLIKEPDLVVDAARKAVEEMNLTLPSGERKFAPHVRFFNVPSHEQLIEHLNSKNINELVAFKGVVTKRTEVMNRVKIAVYRCQICDSVLRIPVVKNFTPPKRCDSCKKLALKQMDEESHFVDIQRGEVQELLERVSGGAPAARIELLFEDDLVNRTSPGENVELVGILRLKPPIKTRQKQELVYTRYLEINNVTSLKRDFEEIEISKEDLKRIKELGADPNIEKVMVDSIAPAIYGHEELKWAIALQLFGGTKGKTMKGGAPIRDDIHILLIGDPGLAKSRIIQQSADIAPKSIYVSGKTVSSVGLTVAAERDELGDGGWTLKAGALVLASGGIAMIDEFDKIEEEDRAALHEAMESAQISIAKAGMVAKFRTKTSILAAANPKWGRFDQNKNLADQFAIAPTLLSRFDLIFPIVDVLDEEKDSKLAHHILQTHMGHDVGDQYERLIDKDILRKYIAYARRTITPTLSKAASDKIKDFYVELRRKGKDTGAVTITPRYLEGLVRLAEANAKLRLSKSVEEHDADTAIRLFNYVMRQVMTDKETGTLDVDVVATGKPKSIREKLQKEDTIMEIIREILKSEDSAEVDRVIEEAINSGLDENEVRRYLNALLKKGEIYEREHGYVKIVGE
jgi:replicative DNA helicase Mcm